MFERPQSGEQAILFQLALKQGPPLEWREFKELARSAGAIVLEQLSGVRERPDPGYFIGQGKIAELAAALVAHNAQLVIFNHELSPGQERNLEQALKCRVLSRTGLILDIFAQRARTFEGKLQVELAQLKHMATRLVRGWTHLERQKGGIGLRGPGEKQLETDRRLLRVRIKYIEQRLNRIRLQRQQNRKARVKTNLLTVALIGYTNAGKSTLFNTLTGAEVMVANQLFATLDPTLRGISLPGVGKIMLADTVGFIKDLPHHLVEAFRATLEETREADLLLHVVDRQDEQLSDNMHHVNQVLTEIEADQVPQLVVFNKIDVLPAAQPRLERDSQQQPVSISLSALTGQGIDLLKQALHERLVEDIVQGELLLAPAQGQLRARLYQLEAVLEEELQPKGGWRVRIALTRVQWHKICHIFPELMQNFVNT